MKKILVIFGTRPEAIKLCPLVLELKKWSSFFDVKVCVTAQHREMLDQVLRIFEVVPDFDLNVMSQNQTLTDITCTVLKGIEKLFKIEKPDIVIVQGDTTTTFAASLAAFYNKIQIAHVEAGLRTGNKYSPFPEEINRILTGHMADIHFAPTPQSRLNLLREGISENKIQITGNTGIDALLWVKEKLDREGCVIPGVSSDIVNNQFILITGHRRENFGEKFNSFCKALKFIAEKYQSLYLIYPVHLNPNVRKPVFDILGNVKNILLIEPLDYLPFVFLMSKCYLIISDSGGIQEEAPTLGKPVLVTRDTTERPEAIAAGTACLVGTDIEQITGWCSKLLDDPAIYNRMAKAGNPYGDGTACKRIAEILG